MPEMEQLKLTFGVRSCPLQLFYKDGVWYEQDYMQVLINNVRTFIEGRYLIDEYAHQKFETPWLIPRWAMPAKYVYNEIWQAWVKEYKDRVGMLMVQIYPPMADGQNLMQLGG